MRKFTHIFTFGILMMMALAFAGSCSQDKKSTDTPRRQAPVPLDTVDTMPSPDRMLADVKGEVSSIEWTCTFGEWVGDSIDLQGNKPYYTESWSFSDNGSLNTLESRTHDEGGAILGKSIVQERDSARHAAVMEHAYSDDKKQPLYSKKETLEWSGNSPLRRKLVNNDTEETHDFQYDEDGHAKHHEMVIRDGNEGYKQIDVYKYTRWDDEGNWTERYTRSVGMTVYFDEKGNVKGYGDSETFFVLERREITYK